MCICLIKNPFDGRGNGVRQSPAEPETAPRTPRPPEDATPPLGRLEERAPATRQRNASWNGPSVNTVFTSKKRNHVMQRAPGAQCAFLIVSV